MICPQTKQECQLIPQCSLPASAPKTECIEWVKKERRIGYRLVGEEIPPELKSS